MASENWTAADLAQLDAIEWLAAVDYHRQLESTNDRALQLAEDTARALPILVLTGTQTAGRGRGSNRWWSAPGALTMSLLDQATGVEHEPQQSLLSLMTGVAVCEALLQLIPGLPIGIKWPNDIYLAERKLGGVLVEIPRTRRRCIVLGIGLNVNNSLVGAPAAVQKQGTSLRAVAGFSFRLGTVALHILHAIRTGSRLLAEEPEKLLQQWQALSILTGRRVEIDIGSQRISGICQGINRQGALVVETNTGRHICNSGTVLLVQ